MKKTDFNEIKEEIQKYLEKYKTEYAFKKFINIFVGNLNYNIKIQIWTISESKPFIKPSHKSNYNGIFFDKNAYMILYKESYIDNNTISQKYKTFYIYHQNSSNKLKFTSTFFATQIVEAIDIEKKINTEIYRCVLSESKNSLEEYPFKSILPNLILLNGEDTNF